MLLFLATLTFDVLAAFLAFTLAFAEHLTTRWGAEVEPCRDEGITTPGVAVCYS